MAIVAAGIRFHERDDLSEHRLVAHLVHLHIQRVALVERLAYQLDLLREPLYAPLLSLTSTDNEHLFNNGCSF